MAEKIISIGVSPQVLEQADADIAGCNEIGLEMLDEEVFAILECLEDDLGIGPEDKITVDLVHDPESQETPQLHVKVIHVYWEDDMRHTGSVSTYEQDYFLDILTNDDN